MHCHFFRHYTGDYKPPNYQTNPHMQLHRKSRGAKNLLNDRGALTASNQGLEMLMKKTWG